MTAFMFFDSEGWMDASEAFEWVDTFIEDYLDIMKREGWELTPKIEGWLDKWGRGMMEFIKGLEVRDPSYNTNLFRLEEWKSMIAEDLPPAPKWWGDM